MQGYLCVTAGPGSAESSLFPCRPEKADDWDSLALELYVSKVGGGSEARTSGAPARCVPLGCVQPVWRLVLLCQLWGPAEPFLFIYVFNIFIGV